ncbi:acyltransferase family protein [Denitromonas halophila]|uniref:Acyltransferase n=1 Tax=Denitromonas halophila TaxID=1629404 RepID=A0A557R1R2_9RHOO|nr:acyltransferase [Denitromonas halophila]TVO59091.1 acyltransferase [Denitromonas halophila]
MDDKKKLNSVEGVRGLACFMVLMSHLSLMFFPFVHNFGEGSGANFPVQQFIHHAPLGFLYSGTAAVFIFFVLSGFILSKITLATRHQDRRILSMFIKRYPRLAIPVTASCVLSLIALSLVTVDKSQLGQWMANFGNFPHSLNGALYSGAIDSFFIAGESAYNPVLWTMKIEIFGSYLIFALCAIRMKSAMITAGGIAIVASVGLFALGSIGGGFCLGLISFVIGHWFHLFGKPIRDSMALLLLIVGLYFAGAHNDSQSYRYVASVFGEKTYTVSNFLSGIFVVYAALFGQKLSTFVSGKPFVFMGKVSFSAYLIQVPILATAGVFAFTALFRYTGRYDFSAFIASGLSIVIVYTLSDVFYRYVDRPAMTFSSRCANRLLAIGRSSVIVDPAPAKQSAD